MIDKQQDVFFKWSKVNQFLGFSVHLNESLQGYGLQRRLWIDTAYDKESVHFTQMGLNRMTRSFLSKQAHFQEWKEALWLL